MQTLNNYMRHDAYETLLTSKI